jgi:integrase/recombinase XerD
MSKSNRSGKSKCLNKEQLEAFISKLPQKYGLLAETMYFLAARVGEATSIRVRNINSNYQVVTLEKMTTKCKETREIPIGSKLLSDLQGWISDNDLKDDDYIFFSSSRNIKHVPGSKKLSNQSVDEYFSKTFDWIGIQGASTHSFRRSRLTHLMEKNWNVREIMDISGHKNLLSLQQYLDSDKKLTHKKYRQLIEEEVI